MSYIDHQKWTKSKYLGRYGSWEIYEAVFLENKETCICVVGPNWTFDGWSLNIMAENYRTWINAVGTYNAIAVAARAYEKYYINKDRCPCKC